MEVKPGGMADIIAQALTQCRVVMVCGHGSFATGQLLEEAHGYTATLEESCRVLCLLKSLAVNQPEG
jgi:L-fuculose-phosphate aldolase